MNNVLLSIQNHNLHINASTVKVREKSSSKESLLRNPLLIVYKHPQCLKTFSSTLCINLKMSGVLDARYKHRNGTIFDFKMTIHYVVDDRTVMRLISDWISRHQYPECSKNKKFQWFHELVDGFIKARAAYIYRTHELFPLLDYESQSSLVNMLIWYKNRWNNKVTHFGPFGKVKKENWQDKFNEWERKWTQIKKKLGLELDQFGMLKNTSANNEKVLLQSFERAYRKLLEELFGIIRDLEKKLAECIR